ASAGAIGQTSRRRLPGRVARKAITARPGGTFCGKRTKDRCSFICWALCGPILIRSTTLGGGCRPRLRAQARQVPDLDLAFAPVAAARGEALPVRAERYAIDHAGMPAENADVLANLRVPETYRAVAAARGQPPTVGTERHARDPV